MMSGVPTVERRQVFSLELVRKGTGVVIITLFGELDISTAGKFSEFADESLVLPSTQKLVVDLGALTFVDCTGLGSLIALQKRALGEAKRFELRAIPPRVTRLLDLSGLENHFGV